MATSNSVLPALQRFRRRVSSWLRADDYATVKLLALVTLLALGLRLVFLGQRVAHFDEGRVAYWAWHFGDTGSFAYRYIIHGPFIQHVDRWMFGLLGASDFSMRLPVAVVGGLLPLSALLFRRHLRRSEVVAFALVLALNPALLYYSRFMRSDMLVAAFMFTAFGFLVRLYDTRRARYLYVAAFFLALGFASKENALVYVVTWLGATGLLLAKVFLLPAGFRNVLIFVTDTPSGGEIRDRVAAGVRTDLDYIFGVVRSFRDRHASPWRVLGGYVGHVALAVVLFGFVSLFFYAPRGAGIAGLEHPPAPPSAGTVGFWEGLTNPSLFVELVQATTDRVVDQWGEWLEPASGKSFDDYMGHFWIFLQAFTFGTTPLGSLPGFVFVFGLAGLGYVLDRLGYTTPRHLVPFMFYAGTVSIFGYPLGTDIGAPWIATHAIVPLALPAAVAIAWIFRWGLDALSADDIHGVGIVAIVLLLLTFVVANAAVTQVYANTTDDENPMVQYAQPNESFKTGTQNIDRIAAAHENGTDVVVYHGLSGEQYDEDNAYVNEDDSEWNESWWNTRPTCLMWYNSLPLPWYLVASNASVECVNQDTDLSVRVMEDPPPVVITQEFDTTVPVMRLEAYGYTGDRYRMRASGSRNVFTVWVHEEYAQNETNQPAAPELNA